MLAPDVMLVDGAFTGAVLRVIVSAAEGRRKSLLGVNEDRSLLVP